MKRIIIVLGASLGGVLLLLSIYAGFMVLRTHGSIPTWSGTFAVQGLDGAAEILRDENGVAHIFAESEPDAYFAQGFVHAQDRFWQMALTRQLLAGRLSEWFGATMFLTPRWAMGERFTIPTDRAALAPIETTVLTQQ